MMSQRYLERVSSFTDVSFSFHWWRGLRSSLILQVSVMSLFIFRFSLFRSFLVVYFVKLLVVVQLCSFVIICVDVLFAIHCHKSVLHCVSVLLYFSLRCFLSKHIWDYFGLLFSHIHTPAYKVWVIKYMITWNWIF